MAISNYTWEGNQWIGFGGEVQNVGSGGQAKGRRSNLVATEGAGQIKTFFQNGGGHTQVGRITPVNTLFTKRRNGRFGFRFAPNQTPPSAKPFGVSGSVFSVSSTNFFYFMAQDLAPNDVSAAFSFAVIGNTGASTTMSVRGANGATIVSKNSDDFTAAASSTPITDAPGTCFQVEWITNGGDLTPLSTDLANPDLPQITFTLRASLVSSNPDDAVVQACATFDLNAIANLDPAQNFSYDEAVGFFGPGVVPTLNALYNRDFFPPPPIQQPASVFQGWFSFNEGRVGFVPQGLSSGMGMIEPVENEHMRGTMHGCTGWKWDLVGESELKITIIDEPWEALDNPPGNLIIQEDWPFPNNPPPQLILDEQWEPASNPPPTLIQQEDWES